MNARTVFCEVAEISRLALYMAQAGRKAGLHRSALFTKGRPQGGDITEVRTDVSVMREDAELYNPRPEERAEG